MRLAGGTSPVVPSVDPVTVVRRLGSDRGLGGARCRRQIGCPIRSQWTPSRSEARQVGCASASIGMPPQQMARHRHQSDITHSFHKLHQVTDCTRCRCSVPATPYRPGDPPMDRPVSRLIPEFAETVIETYLAGLALVDGDISSPRLEAIRRRVRFCAESRCSSRRLVAPLPVCLSRTSTSSSSTRSAKTLSGMGMDTNVTGRVGVLDLGAFDRPRIGCIVVLDLTDASHGVGRALVIADIVTPAPPGIQDRLRATMRNSLTTQSPRQLSQWSPNDRAAVGAAIK